MLRWLATMMSRRFLAAIISTPRRRHQFLHFFLQSLSFHYQPFATTFGIDCRLSIEEDIARQPLAASSYIVLRRCCRLVIFFALLPSLHAIILRCHYYSPLFHTPSHLFFTFADRGRQHSFEPIR
jgi:glucan phosphoethanolaminetransferase (alkaline phosphatase superfamily)